MKVISNYLSFFIMFLFIYCNVIGQIISPVLKGPYIGQKPPGIIPEIFAPGIISTEKNEINAVFSPAGREFYFSSFKPGHGYIIMVMQELKEGWTIPKVAPFSGKYSEVDMFITHNGDQFFFISKRPIEKNASRLPGYQIWVMDRQNKDWINPRNLGPPVNSGEKQLYPTVTKDGTIYFGSNRKGFGRSDIFRSQYINEKYAEPENLGDSINTQYDETDVYVAPNEEYIIFTGVNRPEGFGSGDHYISFRKADGSWTKAKNMGKKLNTSSSEFCPMITHDGKYFFFTSGRNGSDDIYWVDAKIIKEYKPENLK